MQTRVSEIGGELAVVIPASVAADAEIAANTDVEVTAENGAVIVRPAARGKYSLQELLSHVTAENRHAETDWGPPVGSEAW